MVVFVVVAAGCGPEYEEGELGAIAYETCPEDGPRDWDDADCDSQPHLCDRPVDRIDGSMVPEKDAIHIAFVGDGFREQRPDEFGYIGSYRRRVRILVDGIVEDEEGIVGSRPEDFHFHRIDVGEPPEGRVGSALGACIQAGENSSRLRTRRSLTRLAVEENLSVEPDVVVELLNSVRGRAHATRRTRLQSTGYTRIRTGSSPRVLSHELGHALIGLADEYGNVAGRTDGECFECDESCRIDHFHGEEARTFRSAPNLTINPLGNRWRDIVDGARPGGNDYDCGLYHPPGDCRMKSSSESQFCAVCREAIDERLRGYLDEPVDPPECRISWSRDPTNGGAVSLDMSSASATGTVEMTMETIYEELPSGEEPELPVPPGPKGTTVVEWTGIDVFDQTLTVPEGVDADGTRVRIVGTCRDTQKQEADDQVRFEVVDGEWKPVDRR